MGEWQPVNCAGSGGYVHAALIAWAPVGPAAGRPTNRCERFIHRAGTPVTVSGGQFTIEVREVTAAEVRTFGLGPTADVRADEIVSPWGVTSTEATEKLRPATIAKRESYELNRFRSYYHVKYGSPWVDEARVTVSEVHAAADASWASSGKASSQTSRM